MSRTALNDFPFEDFDKDRIVDIIKKFSALYFVEILGFCIMGNHFHILTRMIPDTHFKDGFLFLDFGLVEFGELDAAERLRRYRQYVYEAGAVPHSEKKGVGVIDPMVLEECARDFNVNKVKRFRYRTRYFTNSGIIGTKAFVAENYQRFKHLFQSKHEKKPKQVSGVEGLYSLKRLASAV